MVAAEPLAASDEPLELHAAAPMTRLAPSADTARTRYFMMCSF
jgi:hypothetical protein